MCCACCAQGGVLYVKPLKAHALVKKPWYKGGVFVKPSATVMVNVAEQSKKSARGEGNDPSWVRHLSQSWNCCSSLPLLNTRAEVSLGGPATSGPRCLSFPGILQRTYLLHYSWRAPLHRTEPVRMLMLRNWCRLLRLLWVCMRAGRHHRVHTGCVLAPAASRRPALLDA